MKKTTSAAKTIYKTFFFFCVFLGLAFAISAIYCFLIKKAPNILEQYVNTYILIDSVLVVLNNFPHIYLLTLLFTLSPLFAKMENDNILERSVAMKFYLKSCLISFFVFCALFFLVLNSISPLLKQKLKFFQRETQIYETNLAESLRYQTILSARSQSSEEALLESSERAHQYRLGLNHLNHALEISPTAQLANQVLEYYKVNVPNQSSAEIPETQPQTIESATGADLLSLAETSFEAQDFFSAHYFATAASKLLPPTSEEYATSLKLVQEAWGKIEEGNDIPLQNTKEEYQKKKTIYNAILQGAYLQAHKLIADFEAEYPQDKQLASLKALTKDQLENQVFFYSDLERSPALTKLEGLVLDIQGSLHPVYRIEAEMYGYQVPKQSDKPTKPEMFLKNLTLTKYSYTSTPLFTLHAENARIIESKTSGQLILQLTMVSDDGSLPNIFPTIIFGNPPEPDLLYQLLPIDFQTLMLGFESRFEVASLSLNSLNKLYKIAPTLNLHREKFANELIFRIFFPLLVILVCLKIARLSWNFRLENRFKLRYLVIIPLLFIFGRMVLAALDWALRILIAFSYARLAMFTLLVGVLLWLIFATIESIKFYRQAKN